MYITRVQNTKSRAESMTAMWAGLCIITEVKKENREIVFKKSPVSFSLFEYHLHKFKSSLCLKSAYDNKEKHS